MLCWRKWRRNSRNRERRRRWVIRGMVGYVVLMIGVMVTFRLVTHHIPAFIAPAFSWIGGATAGAFAVTNRQKKATTKLARFDDVRAVGPLAEALEFQDATVRVEAEQALIRLLPRLQASDELLLTGPQRLRLNHVLEGKSPSKRGELARAILLAWQQVGDSKALPIVERMVEGAGLARHDLTLVPFARECLPFLRVSAERLQASGELLRAASNAAATPELLRAAYGPGVSDPATLPRAVD